MSTELALKDLFAPGIVGDGSSRWPWNTDGLIEAAKKVQEAQVVDLIEVSVCCQDPDGNDPWEAPARFQVLPKIGESIEVWVKKSLYSGESMWLEVKDVAHCAYWPERIEIWVSTDGHSDDDMRWIFEALKRNDHP